MRARRAIPAALAAALVVLGVACADPTATTPLHAPVCLADASDDPRAWRRIFDGETFSGWYSWNPVTGRDDAEGFFRIEPGGVIHVLDVPDHDRDQTFAFLSTVESFEDVRIHLEYKWGTKVWNPFRRLGLPRDSGLFYAVSGPDALWPTAVECQIMLGIPAGTVLLGAATLDTRARVVPGELWPVFSPDAPAYSPPRTTDFNRTAVVAKSAVYERPDDWNTLDVVWVGDRTRHAINGHVVFEAHGLRRRVDDADPFKDVPLGPGRIALQEEGAEIRFRDIRVQRLDPTCSDLSHSAFEAPTR